MSEYNDNNIDEWENITKRLIKEHPLKKEEIVSAVLKAWDETLASKIGTETDITLFDINPSPQILGIYLHELIPIQIASINKNFRKQVEKNEKDIVNKSNENFSFEIKTSSHPKNIYGNRSFAQPSSKKNNTKDKNGYYLAVNFEKIDGSSQDYKPEIKKIRFGYLDHSDWVAQKSQTGQQASLKKDSAEKKLITLYEKKK